MTASTLRAARRVGLGAVRSSKRSAATARRSDMDPGAEVDFVNEAGGIIGCPLLGSDTHSPPSPSAPQQSATHSTFGTRSSRSIGHPTPLARFWFATRTSKRQRLGGIR